MVYKMNKGLMLFVSLLIIQTLIVININVTHAQCSGINPELSIHAAEQIDTRLSAANPSTGLDLFTNYYATVGKMAADYSAMETKPSSLAWNQDSWTKKSMPLDFSGVAAWNDWGGTNNPIYQGGATLITPRHFVTATHIKMPVGTKVTFINQSGDAVTRTVSGSVDIPNSDITVGVLDNAIDSSIKYYQVIDYKKLYSFLYDGSSGNNIVLETPIAVFNQMRRVFIRRIKPDTSIVYGILHDRYSSGSRASFGGDLIGGDSGQPGFLIIKNQPVLLFVNGSAVSGNGIGSRISEINTAISSLGGGYSVSEYNPSCFTAHPIKPIVTTFANAIDNCVQGTTCPIVIVGSGFTDTNNTIRLGSIIISENISSYENGSKINVIIPSNVEVGVHGITVSNSNGVSNSKTFTIKSFPDFPYASSVSPSSAPMGTTLTITGDNFSTRDLNNVQLTSSGIASLSFSVSSTDGKHLSIALPNRDIPAGTIFKIWIDNDEFGFSDDSSSYRANPATFTVAANVPDVVVPAQETTPPANNELNNNPLPPQDTVSPAISLTSPFAGESFNENSLIVISASASDNIGVIAVQFYLDGTRLGAERTSSPWRTTTNVSSGTHNVYAIARDAAGNRSTSNTIRFNVTRPAIVETPRMEAVPITVPPQTSAVPVVVSQNTVPIIVPTVIDDAPESDQRAVVQTTEITRNLKIGDQGEDVRLLQKMLNTLGYKIEAQGLGSIDNESDFFGENTSSALYKYQEDRAGSGLVPTGALDNATKILLNSDFENINATGSAANDTNAHQEETVETNFVSKAIIYVYEKIVALIGGFFGAIIGK